MKVQREIGQIQLKCFNKPRVMKKSTKMYVKLCGKKHWKPRWIINEAEERQTVLKCLAALSQAAAICSYHSFKIFGRFWLAKIPRITSYCRLNLEEFCDTELMTSIVQQNCQIIEPLTEKTWGRVWVVLVVIAKWRNIYCELLSKNIARIVKRTTRPTISAIWSTFAELNSPLSSKLPDKLALSRGT